MTLAEIRQQLAQQEPSLRDNEICQAGQTLYRSERLDYDDWHACFFQDYDCYVAYFESRCRYAVIVQDHDDILCQRKYFKTLESAEEFVFIKKLSHPWAEELSWHLLDLKHADYSDWYWLQMMSCAYKDPV